MCMPDAQTRDMPTYSWHVCKGQCMQVHPHFHRYSCGMCSFQFLYMELAISIKGQVQPQYVNSTEYLSNKSKVMLCCYIAMLKDCCCYYTTCCFFFTVKKFHVFHRLLRNRKTFQVNFSTCLYMALHKCFKPDDNW